MNQIIRHLCMLTATLLVGCYLIWMDFCLYHYIRRYAESFCLATSRSLLDGHSEHIWHPIDNNNNNNQQQQHDRLESLVDRYQFAFEGISIKLIMSDPMDNYVLGPLASLFANSIDIRHNFAWLSANMVSYSGAVSATLAGILLAKFGRTSGWTVVLAYVLFQVRNWLDDLDGLVARSRLGIEQHLSIPWTPGYVIDGVCDTIGFAAYTLGCYIFLRNLPSCSPNADAYRDAAAVAATPQPNDGLTNNNNNQDSCSGESSSPPPSPFPGSPSEENNHDKTTQNTQTSDKLDISAEIIGANSSPVEQSGRLDINSRTGATQRLIGLTSELPPSADSSANFSSSSSSNRKLKLSFVSFLLQLAFCSALWNRYILQYGRVLDQGVDNDPALRARCLKCKTTFVIAWCWRHVNGHSLMQMLAFSTLSGNTGDLLNGAKYAGFLLIGLLGLTTELHVADLGLLLGPN